MRAAPCQSPCAARRSQLSAAGATALWLSWWVPRSVRLRGRDGEGRPPRDSAAPTTQSRASAVNLQPVGIDFRTVTDFLIRQALARRQSRDGRLLRRLRRLRDGRVVPRQGLLPQPRDCGLARGRGGALGDVPGRHDQDDDAGAARGARGGHRGGVAFAADGADAGLPAHVARRADHVHRVRAGARRVLHDLRDAAAGSRTR